MFLMTIHGACTARVRVGLGQVIHGPECPSGLINLSQPINVTMECTRHAEAPGLQRQKWRRSTVEELVTVCFSANRFPATVLILSFPTVKSLSVFTLESEMDRFLMFHSSPIFLQTFASAFILLQLAAVLRQ